MLARRAYQEDTVSTSHLAFTEKRRSMRIDQTILLTVRGTDAASTPYIEKVPTLTLSCHGCRYRSKHEVSLGYLVLLELGGSNHGLLDSTQARVKWLKETMLGKERAWDVAVELETPGNFWGVVSPPDDWLAALGRAKLGQELRIVSRSEQQIEPVSKRVSAHASILEPTPASSAPGTNEHIQNLVSDALMTAFVKQKDILLGQFRAQLQEEMAKTLNRVVGHCKEELVHKVLRELSTTLEVSARNAHENWVNKIEEGVKSATIRMTAQATLVSEQIEDVTAAAIEQLQLKKDLLRRETTDELKIGSLTTCQQAEDFLQQAAQQFFDKMQQRTVELKDQLETNVDERMARVDCELDKKSSELLDRTQLALLKVSAVCQDTVQGQLQTLALSATEQLAKSLNEQAAEISNNSLSQLQSCTRRYLENISGTIAEVSRKTA